MKKKHIEMQQVFIDAIPYIIRKPGILEITQQRITTFALFAKIPFHLIDIFLNTHSILLSGNS
jgi:hypothetical protein